MQKLSQTSFAVRWFLSAAVAIFIWLTLYQSCLPLADYLVFDLWGLSPEGSAGSALHFFIYDSTKILLLLVMMVYVLALVRAGVNVERIGRYLTGKRRLFGYTLGAFFGAVTPFCSCSSVPLFIGFTTGGIPLGITMAFLIISPIINEVAVITLWGVLGAKLTLIYIFTGLCAGIVGGVVIDAFGGKRWLAQFVLDAVNMQPDSMHARVDAQIRLRLFDRHEFAMQEMRSILRRVWYWVFIGVGVGALIHGYVPQERLLNVLGSENWWTVPVAVTAGIPLYTNVTGVVAVMESLLLKGVPIGTTLAFCMSTVAASLPEVLMLKQVMRWQLIALFLGILLVLFTLMGWILNYVNL